MDSPRSMDRNMRNMIYDMLVRIFSTFHVLDLVFTYSRVCPSWTLACADASLWNKLDLTALGNYFLIPQTPFAWSDETSSNLLTRILIDAFDLSCGKIKKLIFHFHATINDEHLRLAAERCPNLEQLVLTPSGRLTIRGLQRALIGWRSSLESLVIPFISTRNHIVMVIIGETCLALKDIKFACCLNLEMATTLVTYLPNLRALSLRGAIIHEDALELILENMPNLEVLNITHAMVILDPQFSDDILILPNLTDAIIEKASRLSKFYTCNKFTCETCMHNYFDALTVETEVEGYWYHRFGEEFWKEDEVESLTY